jgi:predicted nucleotidyltransferase
VPTLPATAARALTARFERRRAVHAARAAELRTLAGRILEEARDHGVLARAWLIGSVAWGGFGEGSDLDVVVEGTPLAEHAALWAELCSCGVDVDLLRLEELPQTFRARVLAEGLPVVT